MKHTYLVALSTALLLTGVGVVPAMAAPGDCSGGGTFAISGSTVSRTNPLGASSCSGTAVIPNTVTVIEEEAFLEAENLTTVTFAEVSSLTTIRVSAFAGSGVTALTIPASVTTIESFAFALMPSLTAVTFESGSSLTTLGVKAFGENPALTSVTFRGMSAPTSVADNAFSSIGVGAKLYLEDGATGFGSVGQSWKGLTIAAGGTIITPTPPPSSGSGSSLPPLPPVVLEKPAVLKTFPLDAPFLAKQQKKVLRNLIQEVGVKGSFEVVAGVVREPGQTKAQAKALALAKARAIKKYLVLRGVKKRDVSLKTKIYKVGARPMEGLEALVAIEFSTDPLSYSIQNTF
jgi:hypothetical protein